MKEMRGWLMLLASLFANMTFQAGLNPPDGFWQDSSVTSPGVQQKAGEPILYDTHRWRPIFFWSNTVAFAYSMIMVMLLLSKRIFNSGNRMIIMRNFMIINSFIVAIAFAAGS
ncbi:unnamed protein product, partial [Musa textilis]